MEVTGTTLFELWGALETTEKALKQGESVRVQLCTMELATAEALTRFSQNLAADGFHASGLKAEVIGGVPTTTFILTKGSPFWPLLIPMLPVVLMGGFITFGIVKIKSIANALMPILLVVGAVIIVTVVLLRKPAEIVATKYLERGGPLPLLKGV